MKQFCLAVLAVLTLGSAVWALDTDKMAALERDNQAVMQAMDAPSLLAFEKDLGTGWTSTDLKAQFKAGIVAHNLGLTVPGKGWAAKAAERLQAPAKAPDPELAIVAQAYLGSAKSLMANDDPNPVMKIGLVNQGWDLLDDAVKRGGDSSFLPRFLRANVGQSLPEFFKKNPAVVADTQALEVWMTAHPDRLDQGMGAQIALMKGNALKRAKDLDGAIVAWKRALALDPNKKGPGKTAAAALELYEE